MLKAKDDGLKRKLVGFALPDKSIPRHGFPITNDGVAIGQVTSGTFSPSLQKPVGMGYVNVSHSEPGAIINILIRGKEILATVVKLPFLHK